MANVINIDSRKKNYAYCSECGEQTFFIILDDDENITESECATCKYTSEFELDIIECTLEVDHYTKDDDPYP